MLTPELACNDERQALQFHTEIMKLLLDAGVDKEVNVQFREVHVQGVKTGTSNRVDG